MKNQPLYKRTLFALQGIQVALKMEASFRLQCIAALLLLIVLACVRPSMIWWALLLLTCGLVLAAELFNTALERLTDHLHPDVHPSIKIVKDCAAASVLVLSLSAVAVFVAFLIDIAWA